MSNETKTIHVAPQGELASLLEMAKTASLLLEMEGLFYRVQITALETGLSWEHYDPTRVKQALSQSAGALGGVDGTQLLSDLHAQRQQVSTERPTTRMRG